MDRSPELQAWDNARREVGATVDLLRPHGQRLAAVAGAAMLLLPLSGRVSFGDAALSILLAVALAALVVIDSEHFRLPDALTLPLIVVGVLLAPPQSLLDSMERLAAAMVGFAIIFGVAEGYRRWRDTDGIGLGDAKLFAAAGAWCTIAGLASVLLIAALAALAGTLLLARLKGEAPSRATRIAFGPYLALAFWIVWLFGPML